MVVKFIEFPCGFSFYASYLYPDFLLTFFRLPFKQKGIAEHLIGVSCVEWLLGKNYTNNSLNELFNCF